MFPVSLHGDDDFEQPEYVFVESTGVGQPPDWLEDDQTVSLESALLDLKYLGESMLAEGGMNRQFAMEAHRAIPGFAEKYPLGFFTEVSTQTNYRVAMEELHTAVWAAIGAAAAAIAFMLWKFVRWIMRALSGDSSSDSGGDSGGKPSDSEITSSINEAAKASEKREHQIPEVARALNKQIDAAKAVDAELESVLAEMKTAATGHTANVADQKTGAKDAVTDPADSGSKHSLPENISRKPEDYDSKEAYSAALVQRSMYDRYKSLIDLENHEWYDQLTKGAWTQMIFAFGPILSSVEGALQQRIHAVEMLFVSDLTHGNALDFEKAKKMLAGLTESLPTPGTPYTNLEKFAQDTFTMRDKVEKNTKGEKFDPIIAAARQLAIVQDPKYHELNKTRTMSLYMMENIHKLEMRMADVSNHWNAAHAGTGQGGQGVPLDVSNSIARVTTTIKQDLANLVRIIHSIQHWLDSFDRFMLATSQFQAAFFAIMERQQKALHTAFEMPQGAIEGAKALQQIRAATGGARPNNSTMFAH